MRYTNPRLYFYNGLTMTDVFVQLVSGQRSVTFDDSCIDTSVMSSHHPPFLHPPAAAAAGDVVTCCCDEAATILTG